MPLPDPCQQNETRNRPVANSSNRPGRSGHVFGAVSMAAMACAMATILHTPSATGSRRPRSGPPETIGDLVAQGAGTGTIVRANLLCAEGLGPPLTPTALPEHEATVRSWASRVRSETERHLYRFRQNPAEYDNSEAFFRTLILTVVLAEDFKIHYDSQRKAGPTESGTNDGFFSDPDAVFITGLLGPERRGTCSSLPVLYVAIGRELGYPLKLVTTKGHLFVRWDGNGERFNIEATAHGLARHDDDYYRHWPFEISPEEENAEGYLKSLTPPEELAVFLSIRGMCLRAQARLLEAAQAFQVAARLDPNCASYKRMAAGLQALVFSGQDSTALQKSGNQKL